MKVLGFACFLIFFLLGCLSYHHEDFVKNYPVAHTSHNKVMGLVLAYNLIHIDPIILILNEYLSMCEAGWDPTVVIFTTVQWSERLHRLFRQKMFCYRTGQFVPIMTSQHDPSIGLALGAQHRTFMAQHLDKFDVFIYHEDDIVVKLSHLVAYLNETRALHQLLPMGGMNDNLIGFQRFRRIFKVDGHSPYGEQDVLEQELLEEMPDFVPICITDKPYLVVRGNIHQAMWILTRSQVEMLQDKCSFLNQSSPSREYMSSFSLFDHKRYHCAMTKLLPGERFMTFTVLHYYQQRHVSWTPTFTADECIRSGRDYRTQGEISSPECWKSLVEKARKEQTATISPSLSPTMSAIAKV